MTKRKKIKNQRHAKVEKLSHELTIAIFDFGSKAVLKLDLAWLNIKVFHLEDPEFKSVILSTAYTNDLHDWSTDNFRVFEEMVSNESGYHPYLYAFVPIDFSKTVTKKTIHLVEELLLVMFPSDFQVKNIISYHEETEGKYTISHWSSRYPYSQLWIKGKDAGIENFFLHFEEADTRNVNKFFLLAWKRLEKLSYLQLGVRSYVNSFSQHFLDMKFIGLCITLESLTNATTEITHRIARTCAVVNASSVDEGKIIYFNASQFYSLRSSIVHGNNHKNLSEYFFNLQALVSRTLIELITLNIPDREKLNELVNESGYGYKKKWAKRYTKKDFNKEVSKLVLIKVQKYSK